MSARSKKLSKKALRNRRRERSRARRSGGLFFSAFMLVFFIVAAFQIVELARYADSVTTPQAPLEGKADGIVVLTGGENRLHSATRLLNEGKAGQMLITGVNTILTQDSLKKVLDIDEGLFNCCVELDWSAHDTVGNALATQKWARDIKAKKLIVVTGALHMPRALKELGHAVDGVELIAAPVNVPSDKNWWRDYSHLKDMLREYSKLSFVSLRDHVNAWTGQPWPSMPIPGLNKYSQNQQVAE